MLLKQNVHNNLMSFKIFQKNNFGQCINLIKFIINILNKNYKFNKVIFSSDVFYFSIHHTIKPS